MWTRAQSDTWLAQQQATFVKVQDGWEWWRLPNKNWVARRAVGQMVEMRNVPCAC